MDLIQTLRSLDALRRSDDVQVAAVAKAISGRLIMFNANPSAGDYFAELDRAERLVKAEDDYEQTCAQIDYDMRRGL